jgi:hypothetical protein
MLAKRRRALLSSVVTQQCLFEAENPTPAQASEPIKRSWGDFDLLRCLRNTLLRPVYVLHSAVAFAGLDAARHRGDVLSLSHC